MKKTFSLILLTFLTIGLFRPITALAEEQKLPSGIERDQRRAIPRHQPMPAPQVPPTVTATPSVINTRPGVRLHLCR